MNKKVSLCNFFKIEYIVLLLFLLFKYYLITNVFTSEIPAFGLDDIRRLTVFLLSLIHIVLYTAILIKIKNCISDNVIFLSLLVTDPFYITGFNSTPALTVAIVFEILVLFIFGKNKIVSSILLVTVCLASPAIVYNISIPFLSFVLFVAFLLAEKFLSYKTAICMLSIGVGSSLVGYSFALLMKKGLILAEYFGMLNYYNLSEYHSDFNLIFRIVFLVLLFIFEIIFWVINISEYRNSRKTNIRQNNFKKANKIKNKKRELGFTDEKYKYLLCISVGLITCLISFAYLSFNKADNIPTATLSVTISVIALSNFNSNRISEIINSNSSIVAIILIVFNSIIAKSLFETSEVMKIINDFAPM